ncbi:hypothetical protein JD844_022523 [Phrynosoma platyrhinos]|uniref:Dipeptidylpeptidase IV N-terminal domain-containing protein n=1 Tax=Phrynosoma platyrhinos TaxID=52577 RepID=A0ABQ7SVL7_PHRPL|nr:hypothetical protein JD844_022523 [Phrynosoma platyrhinos]
MLGCYFKGIDQVKKSVSYFLSTENSPRGRQLHSVYVCLINTCFCLFSVSTVDLLNRQCLSCNFLKDQCTYFNAKFSPTIKYFILHCKGKTLCSVELLT